MRFFKRTVSKSLLVFVFSVLVTLIYFLPMVKNPNTLLPDDYDSLLVTWSVTRIAQNPLNLFQGNIFHSHPNTHAFSDPYILSGVLAMPIWHLFKQPVLVFSFTLLSSQVFLIFFFYLFLKKLTQKPFLSLVFSLLFSFSPIHLHYLAHLHTFSLYLLPLFGLAVLNWLEAQSSKWLFFSALLLALQTSNTFLPVWMMVFLGLGLVASHPQGIKTLKRFWKEVLVSFLGVIVLTLPVTLTYFRVSQYYQYTRPLTEVIHFSLSPEELVTKFSSPLIYLGFLVASYLYFKTSKKDRLWKQKVLFWLTLISFIVSLGPALHWRRQTIKIPFHIPLPYLGLYFLAPGFKAFRTPSRWINLMAFSGVCFTAVLASKVKLKKSVLLGLLILVLVSAPQKKNWFKAPPTSEYPPAYHWLKNQPQTAILELPIYTWGFSNQSKNKIEAKRMLYSLVHQHNLVNGYSGFFPPQYYSLVKNLNQNFPSVKIIEQLKDVQVEYIIVNQELISSEKLDQIRKFSDLKEIKKFKKHLVYEI